MKLALLFSIAIWTFQLDILPTRAKHFESNLRRKINKRVKSLVWTHKYASDEEMASILFNRTSQWFPINNVFVMVYKPSSGYDKHTHWYCQGLVYFLPELGRNLVIAIGSRKGSEKFNKQAAYNIMAQDKYKKIMSSAEEVAGWLKTDVGSESCKSVFLISAIINARFRYNATNGSVAGHLYYDKIDKSDYALILFG